jgi:hypothetical protein
VERDGPSFHRDAQNPVRSSYWKVIMNELAKLERILGPNKLSLEVEKVAANPIVIESSQEEGLEHYRCQLLRHGRRLDVYLSVRAGEEPLTLFDVLFMLTLDASGCDMMTGFEKYRDKWNTLFGHSGSKPKDIELFWEELEGRCRQTKQLREFLGSAIYEELLDFFGLEENREAS